MDFEKVRAIIAKQLDIDPETITPSSSLIDDLHADSLDIVELVMDMEQEFDVELKVPVEQYLQTDRAIKYAFLIILLTFAAVFFVEMRKAKPIHPVQYLLIGIALIVFYTLLLSFSEHMNFGLSYLIACVMTIAMIVVFMASITKDKKTALGIGLLLAVLYTFVYVLLQLESYALLVGSVGLFIILGIAMFATQKIDWYKKKD